MPRELLSGDVELTAEYRTKVKLETESWKSSFIDVIYGRGRWFRIEIALARKYG